MDLDVIDTAAATCPAMADLNDPLSYLDGSLHPVWAAMRTTEPVSWNPPSASRPGYWNITGYRESNAVLRDHRSFSSEHGTILASIEAGGDSAGGSTITLVDPPAHRAIRSRIGSYLTQSAAQSAEPAMRVRVRGLIEPWLGGGTHDVAAAMERLSAYAFGETIGILPEHWDELSRWTTASIAPEDPRFSTHESVAAVLANAHHHLFACFRASLHARRSRPADDIVSMLPQAELDGRRLTEREQLLNIYSTVLGAATTTPHVASHTLLLLARDPELWARVRAGELDVAGLIEEGVRWVTPTHHLVRRATRAVEIGGRAIRTGDWVCVWVSSANRDAARFAEADRFLPGRGGTHLGFGVGPHHCVGLHFARVALRVLIEELTPTVTRMTVAGPVRHLASNWINGITELPLAFQVGQPWTS